MESDCLFCKILAGKIPSYKVYEDDDVLAFLDLFPIVKGHTLMIPKKHTACLDEMSEEHAAKILSKLPKVGRAIKKGLGVDSYNLIQNNGKASGQIIFHAHFHFIPRTKDDNLFDWPKSKGKLENDVAQPIIESIKKGFA